MTLSLILVRLRMSTLIQRNDTMNECLTAPHLVESLDTAFAFSSSILWLLLAFTLFLGFVIGRRFA